MIAQRTTDRVAHLMPHAEGAVRSTRMIVPLAVALFFFLSLPAASAQDQSNTADADSTAIKQVFTDFYESFSHHDARATAMTFAEDGDFTNMFGVHIHGRKAIEDRFASLFSGGLRAAHRTDIVRAIRFISPQVAFVDADTVISGTKATDGSDIPLRKGLMIVVMTKQNGRWLISNFHEAEFPVTRAAPVIAPPNANR
jgi:uncharacterized protein (TIGR02246 family)